MMAARLYDASRFSSQCSRCLYVCAVKVQTDLLYPKFMFYCGL